MRPGRSPRAGIDRAAIAAICEGRHGDPFSILGPHASGKGADAHRAVRAFLPGAQAVALITDSPPPAESAEGGKGTRRGASPIPVPMEKVDPEGFFEGRLPADRPGA